jgi:hypothetical protein
MNNSIFSLVGLFFVIILSSCEKSNKIEKREIEIKTPPSKYFLIPEPKVIYKASNSKINQSFSYEYISEEQIRFKFVSESKTGVCADTINGIASDFRIRPVRRNGGYPGGQRPWRDTFAAKFGECILFVDTRGPFELRVKSTGCKAKEHEECPLRSIMTLKKDGWKSLPDTLETDKLLGPT